ncbi:hypothetical protein ACFYUY_23835 [Kitasatospora sp. NPDC004745]|uniref:hypothetical protein n=1 Tax=Kitasatospora sp. NPDC004745 TaxID=3364019 RepID=UPI0036752439
MNSSTHPTEPGTPERPAGNVLAALHARALQKLRIGAADLSALPWDDVLTRIAQQLPALGGPVLTDPTVYRLAEVCADVATRLRRTSPLDRRAAVLQRLAAELDHASDQADTGNGPAALTRLHSALTVAANIDVLAGGWSLGGAP